MASWWRVTEGPCKILYMSPERVMTHRMLEALRKLPISLIAVDEAHCISRWGPSFRPDYEALERLRTVFPQTPLAAFTATADRATRADIVERLCGGHAAVYVAGFDRPNIHLGGGAAAGRGATRSSSNLCRPVPDIAASSTACPVRARTGLPHCCSGTRYPPPPTMPAWRPRCERNTSRCS